MFHHVTQARKKIISMFRKVIQGRRESRLSHQDMLGKLMRTEENKYKLTDEEIIDQIITILYSGYETVSTTSMMAVKYLHDHPRVLQELRVSPDPLFSAHTFCHIPVLSTSHFIFMQKEHLAVREKKRPEDPIDLNDLKPMRFTRAVSRDHSGRLSSAC